MAERSHEIWRVAAQATRWLSLALLLAGSAEAVPFNLWMGAPSGFGFEPAGALDALALGAPLLPTPIGFISDEDGSRITVLPIQDTVVVPNKPSPSREDPYAIAAPFRVTAIDRDYTGLWLVVRGQSPTDPLAGWYDDKSLIGIGIETGLPWGLVRPDPLNFPSVWYAALLLGHLDMGQQIDLALEYRVAQQLYAVNSERDRLPQLLLGFMELTGVPEPGVVLLLATALPLVLTRQRCRENRRR